MRVSRPTKAAKQPRPPRAAAGTNGAASVDFAPVPRRTSRPKWLDPRILLGLLLVIVSVVIGARVLGASSHTSAVWAAARTLAPGTILVAGDLVSVDVNVGDAADHYLAADALTDTVVGHALNRPVAAGELLPVTALTDPPSGRILVFGIPAGQMPPGVGHGSKIDLYLTVKSAESGAAPKTDRIASGITVQSVTAPASGGLSGASSSTFQVAVLLDAATADSLVRALPTGEPAILLVSGG